MYAANNSLDIKIVVTDPVPDHDEDKSKKNCSKILKEAAKKECEKQKEEEAKKKAEQEKAQAKVQTSNSSAKNNSSKN